MYTSQIKTFDLQEILQGRSGLVFEVNTANALEVLQ